MKERLNTDWIAVLPADLGDSLWNIKLDLIFIITDFIFCEHGCVAETWLEKQNKDSLKLDFSLTFSKLLGGPSTGQSEH